MKRGEIWLADDGYAGRVRPILILSVEPGYANRALESYVIRTTSLRGTAYEVAHPARGMKSGVFDAHGIGTTDRRHLIRKLGTVDPLVQAEVEAKVRTWLGL